MQRQVKRRNGTSPGNVGFVMPTKEGYMEDKQALKTAIGRHTEDMTPEELEMVLRFIHSLKDFR